MSQDWVIDVLTDIRQFARNSRFPGLAEALDDAIIVAALELRERSALGVAGGCHDRETGSHHRGLEEHSLPG